MSRCFTGSRSHVADPGIPEGAAVVPPPLSIGSPAAVAPSAPAGAARPVGALGWLIDADPVRETAQLLDLRNRQSRVAAPTTANRTPQTLRSLFGDA
jgi:hypothetical protein